MDPRQSAAAVRDRNDRKVRIGRVTSNRMKKTIVVRIFRNVRHEKYGRVIDQVSSFKVHDEENKAGIGDLVKIMETRPLSKDKRWRLVEIIERGTGPEAAEAPAAGEP